MQHYGAPTRLLDFTYSPQVAAYFTLEKTRECYSVWAISTKWAFEISLHKRFGPSSILKKPAEDDPRLIKAQNKAFFEKPYVKCACAQNPYYLNERLQLQKGVFLVQGDITAPFHKNLQALKGSHHKAHAIQFIFKNTKELRRTALRTLHLMNISRRSLFPGLQGYAESLSVYLPRIEEFKYEDDKKRMK